MSWLKALLCKMNKEMMYEARSYYYHLFLCCSFFKKICRILVCRLEDRKLQQRKLLDWHVSRVHSCRLHCSVCHRSLLQCLKKQSVFVVCVSCLLDSFFSCLNERTNYRLIQTKKFLKLPMQVAVTAAFMFTIIPMRFFHYYCCVASMIF
jgi:hypothetical protein